jgi:hypothetical protein
VSPITVRSWSSTKIRSRTWHSTPEASDRKNKDLAAEGLTDRIEGTGNVVGGRARSGWVRRPSGGGSETEFPPLPGMV